MAEAGVAASLCPPCDESEAAELKRIIGDNNAWRQPKSDKEKTAQATAHHFCRHKDLLQLGGGLGGRNAPVVTRPVLCLRL